eukprot:5721994-Amphidinium_carterae.1
MVRVSGCVHHNMKPPCQRGMAWACLDRDCDATRILENLFAEFGWVSSAGIFKHGGNRQESSCYIRV